MIARDELRLYGVYLGVQNRLGGFGENEHWETDLMVWDGQYFFQESLMDSAWPPSPFGYFDPDSRYATFLPIRDTGRTWNT